LENYITSKDISFLKIYICGSIHILPSKDDRYFSIKYS